MFGLAAWRERAAARWLARMGNEGEAFDRTAFERWRGRPANARAFDEAAASWRQPLPVAATRYARTGRSARPEQVPHARLGRVLLAACAAALLAMLAAIGYRLAEPPAGPGTTAPLQLATGPGEMRLVRFPDGSNVMLGDGAALELAYTRQVRRVVLRGGHARFDVAHDPARPFQVQAGSGLITARGTLFDVRLAQGAVRILLMRGAIDVVRLAGTRPTGDIRRLAPGQGVTVPAAGPVGPVEVGAPGAFERVGVMLTFDRTSVPAAVAAFNQRNRRQIRLATEVPDGETVSGAFNAADPDGFAQMLATMFDLVLARRKGGDLMLSAKP